MMTMFGLVEIPLSPATKGRQEHQRTKNQINDFMCGGGVARSFQSIALEAVFTEQPAIADRTMSFQKRVVNTRRTIEKD